MFSKSGVITITMKNSSKVKMLLRRDILNQKSASISGSYSHALASGSDKSDSSPIKLPMSKRLAVPGDSSSDSDLGTLDAITWGSPTRAMKHEDSE